MIYEIWLRTDPGLDGNIDPSSLADTHALAGTVDAADLGDAFIRANMHLYIESGPVSHSLPLSGDIIVDREAGKAFVIAPEGFSLLRARARQLR